MPGTIELRNLKKAILGEEVAGFDFQTQLYEELRKDAAANPEALMYDAEKLRGLMCGDPLKVKYQDYFLFSLRGESAAAALDQLVLQRTNHFNERYRHAADIAAKLSTMYGTGDWNVQPDSVDENTPSSKVGLTKALRKVGDKHFTTIKNEYVSDTIPEVVKATETKTSPAGTVVSETQTQAAVKSTFTEEAQFMDAGGTVTQRMNPADQQNLPLAYDRTDGTWKPTVDLAKDSSGTFDENKIPVTNRVVTKHLGPGQLPADPPKPDNPFVSTATTLHRVYFNPKRAHAKTYLEEKLGLLDAEFMHEIFGKRVPYIDSILKKERETEDLEVRKLQLLYASSFLVAPFSGRITNIYKDVGETVKAGEPVARVEDDATLLLVGWLQYRAPLRCGDEINIKTDAFETGGQPLEIKKAKVVSVRGHDADNDEWDVILECSNPTDGTGRRILPLNYTFDYKTTTAEVL